MPDDQDSAVPPPFDTVPVPEPSEVEAGHEGGGERRSGSRLLRTAAILLLIAAAGFGQGLGVMLLFGERGEHLSPAEEGTSEVRAEIAGSPVPAAVAAAPEFEGPLTRRHVLELGHERFETGDIEGARRIASSFLLQLDGQAAEDVRREPEALALLGDVLRYEYERSLLQAEPVGTDGAPGAAAEAEAAEAMPAETTPDEGGS